MEDLEKVFGEKEQHDYFTMIPHLIDDSALTPYAFRLYVHLCRVVGQGGKCWQSTETLAAACHMSDSTVVRAKKELAQTMVNGKPLIIIVPIGGISPGRAYHTIYVNSVWEVNHKKYAKKEVVFNPKIIPGVLTKEYQSFCEKLQVSVTA